MTSHSADGHDSAEGGSVCGVGASGYGGALRRAKGDIARFPINQIGKTNA
jgi:hypothetical protein